MTKSKIPGKLAAVDLRVQKLAKELQTLLPAVRERYQQAQENPNTSSLELAHLRRSIGEMELALDSIQYRPHGKLGLEREAMRGVAKSHPDHTHTRRRMRKAASANVTQPAARGVGGQFAPFGSAQHYARHRRTWEQKREETGDGSRKAYVEHASGAWDDVKRRQQHELKKELIHLRADIHGMDAPAAARARARMRVLCDKLGLDPSEADY